MAGTLIVVGFGAGVSSAVAERFGREGFRAALVARNAERLEAGAKALKEKGIEAAAFPADAGDAEDVRRVVREARASLGPISAIHWNAYSGPAAGDLMATDPAEARKVFDVAVVGLLAAVQTALADLKAARDGAVLVTNGAFGEPGPTMDGFAVRLNAMGLGLGNAAKAKLVGLLSERLKADGVFVGEVMIGGAVKGTPADDGRATIEPAAVAQKFWDLYKDRAAIRARIA